jgi:hypothetical protein
VKPASFQPAGSMAGSRTTTLTVELEPPGEDATVKLRRLAQVRDSAVITEADSQVKKNELLSRM